MALPQCLPALGTLVPYLLLFCWYPCAICPLLMGTKRKGDQLNNYDQFKSDLCERLPEADEILCLVYRADCYGACVETGMSYVFETEIMIKRRMASSGMLHRVALVRTDVSDELSPSFIRVTTIGELGTTLAVTSNRRTLRRNNFFTACVGCYLQVALFLVHRLLSP
jgi:hypothetical protein